jgi:hypothetical protein
MCVSFPARVERIFIFHIKLSFVLNELIQKEWEHGGEQKTAKTSGPISSLVHANNILAENLYNAIKYKIQTSG